MTDVSRSSTDGGFNIGWIGAGEWVTYGERGERRQLHGATQIASPGGDGLLHLGFDASNVWTAVPIPSSESFRSDDGERPGDAQCRQQVMKLFFDTRGFNVYPSPSSARRRRAAPRPAPPLRRVWLTAASLSALRRI